ncbi:5954_t:CDS:1, partial [Gigaspora rosea]
CSMTILGSEVRRYIKDHGNVTFRRPVVFDEYSEFKSAVDILNNLRDNSISYHDILASKRSVDRIFVFYLTVAEANSFSAYCQFVPGKQNTRHVDFRKQLAGSIFDYYSNASVADRTKKRRRQDSDDTEHRFTTLNNDPGTSRLKSKYVQRRCMGCHTRTTTCCSCAISRAMCSDCWARHIHLSYSTT